MSSWALFALAIILLPGNSSAVLIFRQQPHLLKDDWLFLFKADMCYHTGFLVLSLNHDVKKIIKIILILANWILEFKKSGSLTSPSAEVQALNFSHTARSHCVLFVLISQRPLLEKV